MPAVPYTSLDPSEIGIHPPRYRLPASAHVGEVCLAISDLAASIDFYTLVIGLAVISNDGQIARLAPQNSQRILLELQQIPGVKPIGRRTRLGLFHTAFLLPNREHLASFVHHLENLRVPFGAGDHLYSEALYLTDPDGLTVEVYADRDRSLWSVRNREIVGATEAVRFDLLPAVADDSWHGAPAATTVGHVHLYIGDLKQAARFYHETLGLDIVTWSYPGALFTSAGAYHHHVGLNVWAAGSPPASASDARLLYWQLVLPNHREFEQIVESFKNAGVPPVETPAGLPAFRDPWGIVVALALAAN